MKIYTRTGDQGQTSLFAGGRISKDDIRLHAYGTVDELSSIIGLSIAHGLTQQIVTWLSLIQNELFIVGSDLATPLDAKAEWITRLTEEPVTRLEHEIDEMDEKLPPLKDFILPGGTPGASALHVARTTCRRAERWIVTLSQQAEVNASVIHYVNRLSDWLFTAARYENMLAGRKDTIWTKF